MVPPGFGVWRRPASDRTLDPRLGRTAAGPRSRPCGSQIDVHGGPIRKVEGDRAVGLFQAEHGKCLGDAFGGLALEKGVHDGIQGHARASDPVAAVSLLYVLSNHLTVLSRRSGRRETENLATAKSTGASTPTLILGGQGKMVYGARAVAALLARANPEQRDDPHRGPAGAALRSRGNETILRARRGHSAAHGAARWHGLLVGRAKRHATRNGREDSPAVRHRAGNGLDRGFSQIQLRAHLRHG